MNTKKIIALSFSTLLFACGNETANQSENTSADTTTQKTEVETNYATTLPVGNGFQLRSQSYVISELIGSADSEYSGQLLTVILTDENELLLQIAEADQAPEEAEVWDLGIEIQNPYNCTVNLELTDANKDGNKNELAVWWNEGDGNNGMESGYEMETSGLMIVDLTNKNEMLTLIYVGHYSSYNSGPNANTDDPDYHAKMAEDSEWEICSYSQKVELKNGDVIISETYSQVESQGECVLNLFEEGTYVYNTTEEKYILQK